MGRNEVKKKWGADGMRMMEKTTEKEMRDREGKDEWGEREED